MSVFVEAVIVAAAGSLVIGIISVVKMMVTMAAIIKSIGPSLQALYEMQPHIIKSMRYNNESLKKLGANGSTERSNDCLDAAEAALDRRLATREGGGC